MGRGLFDESILLKGHGTSTDHGLLDSSGNIRSTQPLGCGGSLQVGSAEGIYVAPVSREWRSAAEDSGVPMKSFIASGVVPLKQTNAAHKLSDRSAESTPLLAAWKNREHTYAFTKDNGVRQEERNGGGSISVQPYPPDRPRSAPRRVQDSSTPMPSGRSLVGDINWSREYSDLLLPRPVRPEILMPSQIFTPLSLQKTPRVTQHQHYWSHLSRPRVADVGDPPYGNAVDRRTLAASQGFDAAPRGRPPPGAKASDARHRDPPSWLGAAPSESPSRLADHLEQVGVADASYNAAPYSLHLGAPVPGTSGPRPPAVVADDSYEYYGSHPDIFPVGQAVLPYPRPASAPTGGRRPPRWVHPDRSCGGMGPTSSSRGYGRDGMAPASALSILRSEGGGRRSEPRIVRDSRPDITPVPPRGSARREGSRRGHGYDVHAGADEGRYGGQHSSSYASESGAWRGPHMGDERWRGEAPGYRWDQDSLASLPGHLDLGGQGGYDDDEEVAMRPAGYGTVGDGPVGRGGAWREDWYAATAPLPRPSPSGYRLRSNQGGPRRQNALLASDGDDGDVYGGYDAATGGGVLDASEQARSRPTFKHSVSIGGGDWQQGAGPPLGPLEQMQREQRRLSRHRHTSRPARRHRRTRGRGSSSDGSSNSGRDRPSHDGGGRRGRRGQHHGSSSSSDDSDSDDVGAGGRARGSRHEAHPQGPHSPLQMPAQGGGGGGNGTSHGRAGHAVLPRTSTASVLHAVEPEGDILPVARGGKPRRRTHARHVHEPTDDLDVSCLAGAADERRARSPAACVKRFRGGAGKAEKPGSGGKRERLVIMPMRPGSAFASRQRGKWGGRKQPAPDRPTVSSLVRSRITQVERLGVEVEQGSMLELKEAQARHSWLQPSKVGGYLSHAVVPYLGRSPILDQSMPVAQHASLSPPLSKRQGLPETAQSYSLYGKEHQSPFLSPVKGYQRWDDVRSQGPERGGRRRNLGAELESASRMQ